MADETETKATQAIEQDRSAPARRPWITPTVQRIEAGEAEVGTRNRQDGAFTSS